MEHFIKVILERVARFRSRLNSIESEMDQHGTQKPPKLWNDLVQISTALDREENKAKAALLVKTQQVNDTRGKISETLAEYNRFRELIREIETLFLAYIVRPGYRLKQAVRQREYLSKEYDRLRKGIESGHFSDRVELEAEIGQVLSYGDSAFQADRESLEDEVLEEAEHLEGVLAFDVDDLVDEFEKEHLVRDFKRIVLPATHPDTSDSDPEIFKNVYEVYKKRDYLLMDAYITEYQGDYEPDPEEDPVDALEEVCSLQDRLHALLGRLKRRVKRLIKEMTKQALDDPEAVKQQMLVQREEIRDRVQAESEKILDLREKLEELSQLYTDRNQGLEA